MIKEVLTVQIKLHTFTALFDTGVTHSCVKNNLINSLNIPLDFTPVNSLKLADGNSTSVGSH